MLKLLVLITLATASLSLTLAKSHVTASAREWVSARWPLGGKLFGCAYCISHWVALAFMLLSGFAALDWLAFLLTLQFQP
jgi:hypothetical protein